MTELDWTSSCTEIKNFHQLFPRARVLFARFLFSTMLPWSYLRAFLNRVPLLIGGNKRKYKAWRLLSYQSVQLTWKKEDIKYVLFLHLNEAYILRTHRPASSKCAMPLIATENRRWWRKIHEYYWVLKSFYCSVKCDAQWCPGNPTKCAVQFPAYAVSGKTSVGCKVT